MFDNVYAVVFNGPPSAGKDTAAIDLLKTPITHNVVWKIARFSMPLKQSVCAWLGQPINENGYAPIEARKEDPIRDLAGDSYRQAQIKLFKHMEQQYGPAILGRLLRRHMIANCHDKLPTVFLIPDGGKPAELAALTSVMQPSKVLLLRVKRQGYTYDGDIREYLRATPDVPQFDVNNSDIIQYLLDVRSLIATNLLKPHGLLRGKGNVK